MSLFYFVMKPIISREAREIFVTDTMLCAALAAGVLLFIFNIVDTFKLLRAADKKDKALKRKENDGNDHLQ